MALDYINGSDLINALRSGSSNLEIHKEEVNALNVFPVPDGDTGTNMSMTLRSAVAEGEKETDLSVGKVAKAAGRGALMGARGNSGVILSQVFRGIYKELDNKETADAMAWAQALQSGAETAYKAVMKPVEGTILTVVRECAHGALAAARQGADVVETTRAALQAGRAALARTPQQLPILREAGVVDSGGQGWIYFLEGILAAWAGNEIAVVSPTVTAERIKPTAEEDVDLNYPYCTEVLVKGKTPPREKVIKKLEPLGNSIVVISDFDMMKVHIHTAHPGRVMEMLLEMGSLHDIKINNMLDEIRERNESLAASEEEDQEADSEGNIGLVAVASGDGIVEVLKSLGVHAVVEGGQTMNPSTEDMLKAVESLKQPTVILFPNNKNIIMAAEQVAQLTTKTVHVLPTISVMQAISALIAFDPEAEVQDLLEAMKEAVARVRSGEVTRAVRDAQVNGHKINTGDYLGLVDDHIEVVSPTIEGVIEQLLDKMDADNSELITVFYGQDVKPDEAEKIKGLIEERCSDQDIELHYGGQPYYYYFISVE